LQLIENSNNLAPANSLSQTVNHWVAGSSPAGGAIYIKGLQKCSPFLFLITKKCTVLSQLSKKEEMAQAHLIVHYIGSDPESLPCEIIEFKAPTISEYRGADGVVTLMKNPGKLVVEIQPGLQVSAIAAVQINSVVYEAVRAHHTPDDKIEIMVNRS
jgi:hypothetical protein